jgi:hypothetical protein
MANNRFMKLHFFTVSILLMSILSGISAEFNARETFGLTPSRDLDSSLRQAQQKNKRVLLFFWDSKQKGNYPGLEMKYFAGLQETKKLLKDNFVVVLLDRNKSDAKKYYPSGNIEKAQWVLINSDGTTIKQAAVYGNPDEGLKTIKELISIP